MSNKIKKNCLRATAFSLVKNNKNFLMIVDIFTVSVNELKKTITFN